MYGCQNWQCSAGDSSKPTAKKYKKTTYDKITNDGVQVENLDPTGLRKILLYTPPKCTRKKAAVNSAASTCAAYMYTHVQLHVSNTTCIKVTKPGKNPFEIILDYSNK